MEEIKNDNSYLNKRIKLFKKDAKKSITLSITNICCLICPLFAKIEDGSIPNIFILIFISILILGPISIISNIVTLFVNKGITKIENNKSTIILYLFVWIALIISLLPYLFLFLV